MVSKSIILKTFFALFITFTKQKKEKAAFLADCTALCSSANPMKSGRGGMQQGGLFKASGVSTLAHLVMATPSFLKHRQES